MSEENVERIRPAFDAFNRRDLDAFLVLMDPEVEFTTRYMEIEGDPYYRGHGLDSGVPFEETMWAAGEWRDGKVTWWRTFGSEAEALEAAGLRE